MYRWTYSDDSATQGVGYEGEIAYYGAGGYYFDFPKNKEDARALIQDLEYNTWLNRGTRAVFVDFAIYNCNINVVCAVKYETLFLKLFIFISFVFVNFIQDENLFFSI